MISLQGWSLALDDLDGRREYRLVAHMNDISGIDLATLLALGMYGAAIRYWKFGPFYDLNWCWQE